MCTGKGRAGNYSASSKTLVGTIYGNPCEAQNSAVACGRYRTEVLEGLGKWQPPTASNPHDCVGEEAVSSARLVGAVLSCHTPAANPCLAFLLWKASWEVARILGFLLVLSCQALCPGKQWKTCLLCCVVVWS